MIPFRPGTADSRVVYCQIWTYGTRADLTAIRCTLLHLSTYPTTTGIVIVYMVTVGSFCFQGRDAEGKSTNC